MRNPPAWRKPFRFLPLLLWALAGFPMPCGADERPSVEFFVSPKGNDAWSGRIAEPGANDGPFATVARAQQAARGARKTQPEAEVRVTLRGGTYALDKTIEFGPEDSGTKEAPVIYAAAKGEPAVFSGGRSLDPAAFAVVKDEAILARLPEESRGKVLQIDLRAQGISNFGVMRPRGQGRAPTSPGLELFVNDQALPLARWPNQGMVRRGEVLDKGGAPRYGDFSERGGTFRFDYDRPARWTQAKDLWLSGYFARGYADDTIDVKSIDLVNRTITLARPHRYGLETVGPTQAYFALNLLEEIDEPGEWYLDRGAGLLYLWPPADFAKAKVAVSLLDAPMVAMEGVSHLTLQGLTFENSRGMAICMERGSHNRIAGCTFRNLGLLAIAMGRGVKSDAGDRTGYRLQNNADQGKAEPFEPVSRELGCFGLGLYADPAWNRDAGTGHVIAGCDISNTGAGGIVLSGGDRKTLAAGNNAVMNCHVHHFSRLDGRVPGLAIDGVGNRVAHCLFHHAPLSAIQLHGNDHLIELNEFHDLCLPPAHDFSAFYMGRDPSEQGNVIRHNFFHHIGNPDAATSALYFDDGACGVSVLGNVFYKVRPTVQMGWGHDHVFRNNIVVECSVVLDPPADNTRWMTYMAEPLRELQLKKVIDIRQPPYAARYPGLADIFKSAPDYPRRNTVENNIAVKSGKFDASAHGNWSTDEDPGFTDMARMNFQLKADSPVFQKLPAFQPIPFEIIGR